MTLHLLLDSADPKQWEQWLPSTIFKGITTNPTLLKKANQPCEISSLKNLVDEAGKLGCKELHLQAWGNNFEELLCNGISLSKLKTKQVKIFVKLPITRLGSQVAEKLIKKNALVTFTACYKPQQVLLAEAIGAKYIAPYLGRIDDHDGDGLNQVIYMQKILSGIKGSCEILVASIREIDNLTNLASNGIRTFTISPEVAQKLFDVQATTLAANQFNFDSNYIHNL